MDTSEGRQGRTSQYEITSSGDAEIASRTFSNARRSAAVDLEMTAQSTVRLPGILSNERSTRS